MFKKFVLLFAIQIFIGCESDISLLERRVTAQAVTLAAVAQGRQVVLDNVIACAASNEDPNTVSIFLYPRPGVTNVNFFQTKNTAVDKNDFSGYALGTGELQDVFNGFLLKYEVIPEQEQWIIVSFEEEGFLHVSNPIRIKHRSKPTEYLDENLTVDNGSTMPIFTWQDGTFEDSAIYFHVVSDADNNPFSGTYTFDQNFQYYNESNVVLNITEVVPPPDLQFNTEYNFTLLAVSEDNWVNLFAETPFTIEAR